MDNILRKPYEISVWEDKLTKIEVEKNGVITYEQFYDEIKLATIGSHLMDTPIRAFDPILKRQINQSSTLTFSIFTHFFDEEKQEYTDNPFIKLLVNERKIKLKYDNEWHDFIIKGIEENSKEHKFIYTAQDLFINELSKTGFNIELDTELQNNQGTVTELAETIFKNTDWTVDKINSDVLQQFLEEALYEVTLGQSIIAYDMQNRSQSITVAKNQKIYVFYSILNEKKTFFQFLYRTDGNYAIDNNIITNSPNYVIDSITYGTTLPTFASSSVISDTKRGKRLVRKNRTHFDPVLNRVVNVYKNKNDNSSNPKKYYGYSKFTVLDSRLMGNIVTNSQYFTSDYGWTPGLNVTLDNNYVYPDITENVNLNQTFYPLLKVRFGGSSNRWLYNNGFMDNRSSINSIAQGERYVFNIRHGRSTTITQPTAAGTGLRAKIAEYTTDSSGNYVLGNVYFDFSGDLIKLTSSPKSGYKFFEQYNTATALRSLSYSEMLNKKIGIFLYTIDDYLYDYYIETVEIFPHYTDTVGGQPFVHYTDLSYLVPAVDTYYYYDLNPSVEKEEDIIYLYKGSSPSTSYELMYTNDYEKIRSITAKESNVFNLSQTLCEIFECWIKYTIEHDPNTGKILLDGNYRQKKSVSFHEFIGKDNDRGFKYGINLSSIKRTLDSDAIVSKLIVKQNTNQFGLNGFCTIARADENPTKQNFLLNFRYYINQQLLDFSEVSNDLYLDGGGYLGYFTKLGTINRNLNSKIDELTQLGTGYLNEESTYQSFSLLLSEAENQLLQSKNELKNYTGYTYEQIVLGNPTAAVETLKNDAVRDIITTIKTLEGTVTKVKVLELQSKSNLSGIKNRVSILQASLEALVQQNSALEKEFYKKYSRFIQEGSWLSQDYIDDNLYYLDAEALLNTSVMPQVTYTIDVLELSQVEGYENYYFSLGDKTFIEDVEFFGWTIKDGAKTPYKEEIVISEISYSLDSPENNKVIVQNYKTQFEDLFQRITAVTQSLQYGQGDYTKAAGVVNEDGTIKQQTLENSFRSNAIILANSRDQSVKWDETGITITNLRRPNEIVRLVSGGIFISNSGDSSWTGAVTAAGINTNLLTSGQINTSKINIMAGSFPAFRWDINGISAYRFSKDQYDNPQYFNFNEFIRFDHYGIYGYRGDTNFIPSSEQDIIDNASFSLTWSGFQLKGTRQGSGYFSISSDRDLEIFREDGAPAVHLGYLEEGYYGLQFFDQNGFSSFISTDQGGLCSGNYIQDVRGWAINPNGSVEFENALIRGSLKSTVFTYDEISAQGGSLIIAKASTLRDNTEVPFTTGDTFSFYTTDDYAGIFVPGDWIKITPPVTSAGKVIMWVRIDTAQQNFYTAEVIESNSTEDTILEAGVPLINYGQNGGGHLILRADDALCGPYLDIIKNIGDDVSDAVNRQLVLRLGDLSRVYDPLFGNSSLRGYGLYAGNVYLSGTLALPQAGITNHQAVNAQGEIIESFDNIRLWAGGNYNDMIIRPNDLNFKLYESGRLVLGNSSSTSGAAFTFVPNENKIVFGGATRLDYNFLENTPNMVEVLIRGEDIKKGENSTTLSVQVLVNGADITSSLIGADFTWYINGETVYSAFPDTKPLDSAGLTMTFLDEEIEGSAQIFCIYTYYE